MALAGCIYSCIDFFEQATFKNALRLQKFGPGVGTLPQLEPPVVQVVLSNAKNQQSENILPQIANRGGQNNNQSQVIYLFISFAWWKNLHVLAVI